MSNSSENNRTYRIRTKVGNNENNDKVVSINLNQDIDIVELLSLKIDTTNFYKLHTSNYGCIAGRVLANGGVGVPNAKISVFIGISDNTKDDPVLSELYPFSTSFQKDSDGIRYNLLPDTEVTLCHTAIGTFPSKRMVLDDENMNKVFEKYYKYTTRTNDAGDYMIFGVPVGNQIVHTDIDLSDIGILSQKPRDMIYKGYNITQFENANKFKKNTNIDNLTQVISQNDTVYVFPFWGEESESEIKITRNDINIQYKFEPTCVFIGSLVTDEKSNGVMKNCIATERMGKMDRITTGSGTIEMIRKKPNGDVEEIAIQGNQLIDGNGTWCYQIPMNLDYYMTDEYGNLVPSNDKDKGIPTRTSVRFRVSLNDFQSDYENNHLSKVLIPNNPKTYEELDYHFGSKTADSSFRDLFWNNVYTVKSYIPRIQKGNYNRNKKFTGFKQVNVNGSNNPIPYNNMRVNLTFMFVLQCAILKILIKITSFVNWFKNTSSDDKCSVIGDGICPDLENWYFAPGCRSGALGTTLEVIKQDGDEQSIDSKNKDDAASTTLCVTNKIDYLMQCVEINLAMEYEVIQFDFYNDWINGVIYMPRWFVNIRKKRSYLFGLIKRKGRTEACMESSYHTGRRYVQQCALTYTNPENSNNYTKVVTPKGCKNNSKQKCHKGYGRNHVTVFKGLGGGGLVHTEDTLKGQKVYYFKPAEWLNVSNNNYGTRCIMFATDIVLLGSLKEYNQYGIPKAFEELTSSTYLMPTNLAATNMDSEGYMYGINGYGARCTGQKQTTDPIEPYEQTFEKYVEWSKNTDYYEKHPDDPLEYPITEASGIDWGYSGPNQGGNSLSDLYFPGGHFLGIACFSAEVNIKSCINLSRVCEVGTMISQRQNIISDRNSNELTYTHLIPTGLIAKYEISDSNFRKMFATMNHNGLKTKINKENGYLEYDFISMLPSNFDGGLESYVYNGSYNSGAIGEASDEANAYRSVIEKASDDYYYFRMGIQDGNTIEKKDIRNRYLIQNGNRVSLPMYENSFYFYFGLKDGNTAIDRFFKDFYAKCVKYDEDASYLSIETKNTPFCPSSYDDKGSVTVTITDVSSPYVMTLTKDDIYNAKDKQIYLHISQAASNAEILSSDYSRYGYSDILTHNFTKFTIKGLDVGVYRLSIVNEDNGEATATFIINEDIIDDVAAVTAETLDFDKDYVSYDEDALARRTGSDKDRNGGYITISNVSGDFIIGILIFTDDKYLIVNRNKGCSDNTIKSYINNNYMNIDGVYQVAYKSEWKSVDGDQETYTIPAWRGNDTYTVTLITICNNTTKFYEVMTNPINMSTPLDIYIGDSDLTYNNTIKAFSPDKIVNGDWFSDLIKGGDAYSAKKKWNAKQAIYYRGSIYTEIDYGNILVSPANGTLPYKEVYSGKTETVCEKTKTVNYLGYRNDLSTGYWGNGGGLGWYPATIGEYDRNCIYYSVEAKGSGQVLPDNMLLDIHDFFLPTHYFDNNGNIQKMYIRAYKGFENAVPNSDTLKKALSELYVDYMIPPQLAYNGNMESGDKYDPIPLYSYEVSDADGNNVGAVYKNGSKIGSFSPPSVYRPFFFNAVMTIIRGNVKARVIVSNPIHYNGEIGKIIVNNNEYNPNNEIGVDSSVEFNSKNWICKTKGKSLYGVENGIYDNYYVFSVEANDGMPQAYDSDVTPMTISESTACVFPTKDLCYYSSGVRFYVVEGKWSNKHVVAMNYFLAASDGIYWGSDNEWHYDSIWRGMEEDYSHTDYGNTWNGIFGCAQPTTEGEWKDAWLVDVTDDIYNAIYGEMGEGETSWSRFVDTAVSKSGGNAENAHLIAICDNWTRTNSSTDRKKMWEHVAPDTNIISIAKLYLSDELVK